MIPVAGIHAEIHQLTSSRRHSSDLPNEQEHPERDHDLPVRNPTYRHATYILHFIKVV